MKKDTFYDENTEFLKALSEDMRSAVKDVINELNTFSTDSEFLPLSNVTEEILNKFLLKNSLNPTAEFKKAMTTPFAIAKYLVLLVQQKEAIAKVKAILEILLAKKNITYTIYDDFTNQICFTKELELNSEEKPQCLVIKYRIDKETDNVIFMLPGNNWGWDINNTQLLAILDKNVDVKSIDSTKKVDTEYSTSNDIKVTFNGMDIIIKKHN